MHASLQLVGRNHNKLDVGCGCGWLHPHPHPHPHPKYSTYPKYSKILHPKYSKKLDVTSILTSKKFIFFGCQIFF